MAFNLESLCAIHRYLFQDIYPWAGQLRVVDIAKGDTCFLAHQSITSMANSVLDQLAKENHLRALDEEAFAQRAGYFLGRINRIHPFREGNGRAQRAFMRLLAREAGYVLDFSGCSALTMVDACRKDHHDDDPTALVRIIRTGLSRLAF